MPRAGPLAVALTLLALPVLAGCLAPTEPLEAASAPPLAEPEIEAMLSQPEFDGRVYEESSFEASDGATIWMSVVRPEGVEKVPVIVVMTPYMTVQDVLDMPYSGAVADYFVPRGYAVASVDVRGTHNSGGCLEQTGHRQAQDGYEAVELLASQAWSNGAVGMIGGSYDGETQQSTAVLAPPSLKAIVPIASITSQYLWFYKGGIPYQNAWDGMTFYMSEGVAPPHTPEGAKEYPDRFPCHVEMHREAMHREGHWTPFWDDRYYKDEAANVTAAVLYVHGLQDWNVKPDAIPGWYDGIVAPKRAVLGQWGHAVPTRSDWMLLVHRWFDHFLLGIDTGVLEEPPVWIEDSLGRWRNETSFPPEDAQDLTLYAHRDAYTRARTLDERPPRPGEPVDALVDVPNPPNMPPRTSVTYWTHALPEDVHVSGVPEIVVAGASEAKETHWVAHLVDMGEDGTERTVLRAYLNSRYWETGDPQTTDGMGKDLEPGKVYEFRLDTFPLDHVFEAGHRIGLRVTNDDEWVEQDTTAATNYVHHDAAGATRLVLPVIERGVEDLDARFHG